MSSKRTIKITCQGAATAKLEELTPFQGELKKQTPERYRKLKRAITGPHGFSFPFFVWKNAGKLFVLDGHQRDRVLRRLKAQGYAIPPLPIDYVQAKSEKEAREKILLLSSQYGEMTDESLMTYLRESEIDLDDVLDKVDLPQVDVEKLAGLIEEELEQDSKPAETNGYRYQVIIDCKNATDQLETVLRLQNQQISCRPTSRRT